MSNIKENVRTITATPQQILASSTLDLPVAVAGIMPSISGLKRTMLKARQQDAGPMSYPMNLRELVISNNYIFTIAGEKCLQFDGGLTNERIIIIFTILMNLYLMTRCEHWYADDTFKTAPPLFTQIFTIYAVKYNNVILIVYALLSDKRQEIYTRVLQQMFD